MIMCIHMYMYVYIYIYIYITNYTHMYTAYYCGLLLPAASCSHNGAAMNSGPRARARIHPYNPSALLLGAELK